MLTARLALPRIAMFHTAAEIKGHREREQQLQHQSGMNSQHPTHNSNGNNTSKTTQQQQQQQAVKNVRRTGISGS